MGDRRLERHGYIVDIDNKAIPEREPDSLNRLLHIELVSVIRSVVQLLLLPYNPKKPSDKRCPLQRAYLGFRGVHLYGR